jgi:hypothetical protein
VCGDLVQEQLVHGQVRVGGLGFEFLVFDAVLDLLFDPVPLGKSSLQLNGGTRGCRR